ncbi:hypothetical protein HOG16_02600 [Candidatus Woesearchaeota archaeon]|jgi:hypothetical protein|nr:hypothetical protein [Candidatus Woesearchaeota archaeon]MBT4321987.1 hypothetical protein [Candidatus Woesearchaeota archaeon]MBT4630733.1 hypothetical protein [Candidatus Woesearchaeota archaeon]
MKKSILILMFVFILSFSSYAAMDAVTPFCEHQGYAIDRENLKCVFDDGNSCDIGDFYSGDCGVEYVKDFPCVESGEFVFHFEECCDGLMSHIKGGYIGQPMCKPITVGNMVTSIDFFKVSRMIFPIVVLLVIFIGAIYFFKRRKNEST